MLTVCVPVYNFNVVALVRALQQQLPNLEIPVELLLIDDASEPAFRLANATLKHTEGVRYIELHQNIGRSKIRNLLAGEARYENLLFIDCDAMLTNANFLKEYMAGMDGKSVIIGGVAYAPNKPSVAYSLRWTYGHKRESTNAAKRSEHPYHAFKTFNFLIPRNVLKSITFNESVAGYGHEDTLFGIEMARAAIPVKHISNPLIHIGLEDNRTFVAKTETGIANLLKIYLTSPHQTELRTSIKLLRTYFILGWMFRSGVALVFLLLRPLLLKQLCGKKPSMVVFDMYKLGYLCKLKCI